MKCLNDAQIQAVADREAADDIRRHAASCTGCGDRVRDREKAMAAILQTLDVHAALPPHVGRQIERAFTEDTTRGATRLRDGAAPRRSWRPAVWSAAAVAAATVIAVLFIAPMIKGPATVSAAEILAASADRLAHPVAAGVEFLEYELILDGVPREMMPDHADGVYRIRKVIDHDTPGRYRFATYAADGRLLLSSIAQDPAAGTRVVMIRLDDQVYRFNFAVPESRVPSLPELERLHMEASVAMMQASREQMLQVIETGTRKLYQVEVPSAETTNVNAVWDLTRARVLIDAEDYRIEEFSVSGTFLKQPYSVSYKLIGRGTGVQIEPDPFTVPHEPGEIQLEGPGTATPPRDALVLALRELAKARQAR